MVVPIKGCGTKGHDSTKCKVEDYPDCNPLRADGATLKRIKSTRMGLVTVAPDKEGRIANPSFARIRKPDEGFWVANAFATGICRMPDPKRPKGVSGWYVYRMPRPEPEPTPSSRPSNDDLSFTDPAFDEFFKPFFDSFDLLIDGDYENAFNALGLERAIGIGVAGTLTLVGTLLLALGGKKKGKKDASGKDASEGDASGKDAPDSRKRTTLASVSPERDTLVSASEPGPEERVSLTIHNDIGGTDETVGYENVIAEDRLNAERAAANGAASPVPPSPRSVIISEEIDRAAESVRISGAEGEAIMDALFSMELEMGGMTRRQECEFEAGMDLGMPFWKMAALLARRYYRQEGETLATRMQRIVMEAADLARKRNRDDFGAVHLIDAAERLSKVSIDRDEAKALILYYGTWVESDEITRPFVVSMADEARPIMLTYRNGERASDKDLSDEDLLRRDVVEEFVRFRGDLDEATARERATFLVSKNWSFVLKQAERWKETQKRNSDNPVKLPLYIVTSFRTAGAELVSEGIVSRRPTMRDVKRRAVVETGASVRDTVETVRNGRGAATETSRDAADIVESSRKRGK